MAGNEVEIAYFLIENIGRLKLNHLGIIREIGAPMPNGTIAEIFDAGDLSLISTEDNKKKADIYINRKGVSLKQTGASFAFNRLQRKNLLDIFESLGFSDAASKVEQIDTEVIDFHEGRIQDGRNREWKSIFTEEDFNSLLKHLMLLFNPNKGLSKNPAQFILEAPAMYISENNIAIYNFEEYFQKYKTSFKIAIRRSWIGQNSNSEHARALSISRKPGNAPWIFSSISGSPKSGWMNHFNVNDRKTVYYLMIEKEA